MTAKSVPLVDDARCAMVLDVDLPTGLLVNTAAALAMTLGARLDVMGLDVCDAEGEPHAGLASIPVPILKADAEAIAGIRDVAARREDVFVVDVTDAALTTTSYDDYCDLIGARPSDAMEYLGVALYGDRDVVTALTGRMGLLR